MKLQIREEIDNIKPLKEPIKGELTIVISEDNNKSIKIDEGKIVNKIKKYLKKYSLKDTVDLIVETEKINRKIYNLSLKVKNIKNFKILLILILTSCTSATQFGTGVNITLTREL